MFVLNVRQDYRATLADGWRQADSKAFVLKERAERAFDASRQIAARVRDIAQLRGLDYFRGDGWQELATFSEAAPLIGSVWIIDAEANLVANSLDPNASRVNYGDREYYTALKAGRDQHVTGLLLGRVEPVWFFSYARAIVIDGEFRGVALTSMHADFFGQLHREMGFGPDGALAIYRSDGAVVMRWPLQPSDASASAAESPLFREHLPQAPAGRFESISSSGVPLLTVYATATGMPVVVTAAVSRDAVLQPFWGRFYRDLGLLAIAAILIGGLTYAALAALRSERAAADHERQARMDLAALLSERDQLLASLGESEQRLRLALEAGGMSVWDWDLHARTVILDSFAPTLFRYDPERLAVGEDEAFAQIASKDLPVVRDAVARAIKSGEPYRAEFRHVRADGAVMWFAGRGEVIRDGDGRPVRILGLNFDITDRKHAEEALRESEERLRLAQEAGGIGSWDWDMRTGAMIWSASNFRLLGLDPDEVRPSYAAFFRTIHPDDRGPFNTKMQSVLKDGSAFEVEFRIVGRAFEAAARADAIRWLECRGEVKRDVEGNPIRILGVIRDMTAHRRATQALEQLTAELEARVAERTAQLVQVQKMDTLGQITGGLSHDFNNLLAAVLGNLELLRKRLAANGDAAGLKLLEGAIQGAERGAKLTQRLLSFARRQDLRPSVVDISALIAGMENLLRRALGPSIFIATDFDADLWMARVDANQFEMALLNLAVNARDAMPDGGSLTLSARNETVGAAHPAGLAPGDYVHVVVTDTGVGMDEQTLARVTEPFFTTKQQGERTGLGLSMVHGLAAQSGGALRLTSRPGAGTQAELWLPRASSAPSAEIPPREESKPPARSLRVLLVYDDWLGANSTQVMLEDLGHKVISAPSAAQALEVLRSGSSVDLVITDHAMPGMTGLELIDRIRQSWPRLPVLLATGYAELPDRVQQDLPRLLKPYRQADLAASIGRILNSEKRVRDTGKVVPLRPH